MKIKRLALLPRPEPLISMFGGGKNNRFLNTELAFKARKWQQTSFEIFRIKQCFVYATRAGFVKWRGNLKLYLFTKYIHSRCEEGWIKSNGRFYQWYN